MWTGFIWFRIRNSGGNKSSGSINAGNVLKADHLSPSQGLGSMKLVRLSETWTIKLKQTSIPVVLVWSWTKQRRNRYSNCLLHGTVLELVRNILRKPWKINLFRKTSCDPSMGTTRNAWPISRNLTYWNSALYNCHVRIPLSLMKVGDFVCYEKL
jgi:hypothetical protein